MFDAEFYAEQYPDVKKALGTEEQALYKHYIMFGKAEGRLPVAPPKTIDANIGVYKTLTKDLPSYTTEQEAEYAAKVPVTLGNNDSQYLCYQSEYYLEWLEKEREDYSSDPIYRAARNYIVQVMENGFDKQVIYAPIYFTIDSKEDSDYLLNVLMNLSVDLRKAEIAQTVWVSYSPSDGCLRWGKPWEHGGEYQISCMVMDWDITKGWQ